MRVEKEGSKSGGYAGGFFQLFDWTAKSRKKLFSSKSDLPERPKQGKRSDGNLPITRIHLMDEDENGAGSSIRGSSDYSCASSVTDDGCGAKAPGVVARLMGLDSLPTSNCSEPNSTPFFDAQSLRHASHSRKQIDYYYHDHQIRHSGNLLNREDGPSRNFVGLKPQKVLSKPIEKFQTETLPPKSAKSIPITHHKLLSPIKSPGFIPSKTAAHIMEAAAKIIEPSPQAASKAKTPVVGSSSAPLKVRNLKEKLEFAQKNPWVGSSSVPLKVQDLKDKVEVGHKTSRPDESSRRPVESNAAKYLKGQSLNKSWNGTVDTTPLRTFPETEDGSSGLKNKGKSISLAIQAKVNVQRREGINSSSTGVLGSPKEQNEAMSSQIFKSQPNTQKSVRKKSSIHNASGVLRQNNQKQNCLMDKEKLPPKPLASNLSNRKVVSGNLSLGRQKTSGRSVGPKCGSRKLGVEVTDSEKGSTNYGSRNIPRKKRTIDGNLHLEKNQIVNDILVDNNHKAIQSNPILDRHCSWAEESKKKGMDVVSFTFTAPLARSMPGSEIPGYTVQENSGACMKNRGKRLLLDTDSMKLSSLGYNVIGGDALSSLLEQKLRELTSSVESSSLNSVKIESPSSSVPIQDPVSNLNAGGTAPIHMFQGIHMKEECSSEVNDSRKPIDCRRPSPISVLESSFLTESSPSLDSTDSSSTEGSNQCSSIHVREVIGLSTSKSFHYVDAEMDLSDSASSTSTGSAFRKCANTLTVTQLGKSTNWEVEYVRKILCSLELMFKDFALGRACHIIKPHLFDLYESRKDGFQSYSIEAMQERKLLFDCVSECLDLRCGRYVGGGYKTWVKGVEMVRRKEWLADEVNKEISAWRGMGDCMVDELVEKDMSSQYGRWLDYEVDEFELGVELEGQILSSLVNEVVADILQF